MSAAGLWIKGSLLSPREPTIDLFPLHQSLTWCTRTSVRHDHGVIGAEVGHGGVVVFVEYLGISLAISLELLS
jgi:hypothetical protein